MCHFPDKTRSCFSPQTHSVCPAPYLPGPGPLPVPSSTPVPVWLLCGVQSALPGTPAPSLSGHKPGCSGQHPLRPIPPRASPTPHPPARPWPCLWGSPDPSYYRLRRGVKAAQGPSNSAHQGPPWAMGSAHTQGALTPRHRPGALGLQGSQGSCSPSWVTPVPTAGPPLTPPCASAASDML